MPGVRAVWVLKRESCAQFGIHPSLEADFEQGIKCVSRANNTSFLSAFFFHHSTPGGAGGGWVGIGNGSAVLTTVCRGCELADVWLLFCLPCPRSAELRRRGMLRGRKSYELDLPHDLEQAYAPIDLSSLPADAKEIVARTLGVPVGDLEKAMALLGLEPRTQQQRLEARANIEVNLDALEEVQVDTGSQQAHQQAAAAVAAATAAAAAAAAASGVKQEEDAEGEASVPCFWRICG